MYKGKSSAQRVPAASSQIRLAYTCAPKQKSITIENDACYYVYNVGQQNGFVIVSGDDRAKEILGYTDNGSFDINRIPDNLKYWLSCYEKEIELLKKQPDLNLSTTITLPLRVESGTSLEVQPLLGNIKWNQHEPYNLNCPLVNTESGQERCIIGCVATAMAQIMRYHRWPEKGSGSNSYTTKTLGIALSEDFSNIYYDWDNMSETYNSLSSVNQNNAVAKLMYHCGVSVNMDYNPDGSGSNNAYAAQAFIGHFDYDSNIQVVSRSYYTEYEWIDLLKTELNASRPVFYRGSIEDLTGHAFVCDGYDSNNLFHINWGWGGEGNGYYEISALNPKTPAITTLLEGFNIEQGAIIGIQKPTGHINEIQPEVLHILTPITTPETEVERNSPFTINVKEIISEDIFDFNGEIALGLYNGNNELVQVIGYHQITGLGNLGEVIDIDFVSKTIPESISAGDYKLYCIHKSNDYTNWAKTRGKTGTPNFLDINVSDTKIRFTTPTYVYPQLVLNSTEVTGHLYKNKTGRVSANVTNNGGDYNSALALYMVSVSDMTSAYVPCRELAVIGSGKTKTVNFLAEITAEPGTYYLYTLYDPLNNLEKASVATATPLSAPILIQVLPEPQTDSLTLTEAVSFPNVNAVDKNNTNITIKVKNNKGFFDRRIKAYVYPAEIGSPLALFGSQDMLIDDEEEQTLTFTNRIDLDPGNYRMIVFAQQADGNYLKIEPYEYSVIPFTLVDNVSTGATANSENHFSLFPNPATDKLNIRSDEKIFTVRIFNLLGKQVFAQNPENNIISVQHLISGTYLIQIESEKDTRMLKFIKQ